MREPEELGQRGHTGLQPQILQVERLGRRARPLLVRWQLTSGPHGSAAIVGSTRRLTCRTQPAHDVCRLPSRPAIGPVRACPWTWSSFCPCAPASGLFCPCDARPPGLSVRAIGAGGPELQPTSPLLSVDPGPGPVRYLSVTSVTTWPSMTADDTGREKANGPRIRRLGRSRAVCAGGGR
jgi:hypothetical protein